MSGPGNLRVSVAALDAAPEGMLAVPGRRGQSPAGATSFISGPWRPSSAMSGSGDLRRFAAALDAPPGGMLTVLGCRGQSPAGTKLFLFGLCLALEAELIYVWPLETSISAVCLLLRSILRPGAC